MSALWHTAKRGGQGLDGRRTTSFSQCTHEGCTGRILRDTVYEDGPDLCFAHADDRQRTAALLVTKMHKRVDVRGTVLNEHHVQQILNGVSAERFVFRGCTFTGNAPLPGTMLKIETASERGELTPSVAVDFGHATFEAGADFRNVAFPGRVFFDDVVSDGPEVIAAGSLEEISHGRLGRMKSKIESGDAKPLVTFSFLDGEGYRWRRIGSGAPQLIGDAEPAA
ncbi:hypothetical protein ABZ345_34210 [Lentzea sp. NPDC005914]|uniref:hypothetical protein n=1 Tax=Lentzea sp. NPDC005914 TaxID=3154572 RepID=UPI0033DA734A